MRPRLAAQPMPAFCVSPKRSPEGQSLSISPVRGSEPSGPSAFVVTSKTDESEESRIAETSPLGECRTTAIAVVFLAIWDGSDWRPGDPLADSTVAARLSEALLHHAATEAEATTTRRSRSGSTRFVRASNADRADARDWMTFVPSRPRTQVRTHVFRADWNGRSSSQTLPVIPLKRGGGGPAATRSECQTVCSINLMQRRLPGVEDSEKGPYASPRPDAGASSRSC